MLYIYIYIYIERERERKREIKFKSTEQIFGNEKNILQHDTAKIHGGQSEVPEQRYLKMTVLMML